MNAFVTEWPIARRSEVCTATQRPFEPGEVFYTLLYRDGEAFRREDLSEAAWQNRNDNIQPFSFWRTTFQPEPSEAPEPVPKESAEALFRRLIERTDAPAHASYVLAIMLERKRVLRQRAKERADGRQLLIYEHIKDGTVFVVVDPELRLDDLERVQTEVMQLLKTP